MPGHKEQRFVQLSNTYLDKGTQDEEDEVEDRQSWDDVVVQDHRLMGLIGGD